MTVVNGAGHGQPNREGSQGLSRAVYWLKSPWSASFSRPYWMLGSCGRQILRCRKVRFVPFGNSADRTNRAENAAVIPQEGAIGGVDPRVRVSLMAARRLAGDEIVMREVSMSREVRRV
jgi:hypothetical protein